MADGLLMTMDRIGAAGFPLTRTGLADMVGVWRTTISGLANQPKHPGLIDGSRVSQHSGSGRP